MDPSSIVFLAAGLVLLLVATALLLRSRRAARRAVSRPPAGQPEVSPAERLRRGLLTTRRRLAEQVGAILGPGAGAGEDVLSRLEETLVAADVGVRAAGELVASVRGRIGRAADARKITDALRQEVETALQAEPAPTPSCRPWVVLVVGVNGVGKTTTIGKLAALNRSAGRRVLLVAGDTFRAAAGDQLAIWAQRTGAELVRQGEGADPSAVVFDGMKAATARDVDIVFIDTAGRLHTRTNLMEELGKVRRVIERVLPGAPHETLLVLDATTGQNAVAQARTFAEKLGVTGIVLTKLDGTARGGVVIAIRRELGVPIRYVGLGEAADDLRPFDARLVAEALFGEDPVAANP
jgi:fused signal recognition particle receptor